MTKQMDLVPSTRIRLARNLKQFPFERKMSSEQKQQLIQQVQTALQTIRLGENSFRFYSLQDLSERERYALVERHLISLDLAKSVNAGFAAISKDETISVMVNEEDHIRIQVILPGLDLDQAWELASRIDDCLDHELDYAYDQQLGYLTACPTNLGTGLRASVMLHLPALQRVKAINELANAVGKLGLTIRGSYGEGTGVQGDLYTVSNQITLGIAEPTAMANLERVVHQIIEKEQAARQTLKGDERFIDQIYRDYGVLKYAKLLSSSECDHLVSSMRLGVSMGVIKEISLEQLNQISAHCAPNSLCCYLQKDLKPAERDRARAQFVQSVLYQH